MLQKLFLKIKNFFGPQAGFSAVSLFLTTWQTPLMLLLFVVVVLVAYSPFYWNLGFISDFGDPTGQTIPNKFLLVEYLKNGILPLWNSFSFLGFPFLADIQVGTFYVPDILIFWLFPPVFAHNVSVLFHLVLGGIGTFLLVKALSKSSWTAFALACVMALSGSFLTRIVYLNFLETIVFLPWVLWLLTKEKVSAFSLAIFFVLMIFAGHPVAFFYSLCVVGGCVVFVFRDRWKKALLALVLALLLASIQIVPFLALKADSVRSSLTYEQFTEGSIPWSYLWNFLNPSKEGMMNVVDFYIHFGTVSFLLLVGSVFFFKKFDQIQKRIYIAGLILFILGILLSLGDNIPLLPKILYKLPLVSSFRVPARYMMIAHFGAVLALAPFLAFLLKRNKYVGAVLHLLLILNLVFVPQFFLFRYSVLDAEKNQYLPHVSSFIEHKEGESFALFTQPRYFLSSSFFLYPNRHILSLMPNMIGYNPLITKHFYKVFPVGPGGSFENPNYFLDYYEKLETFGLTYFIFPTEEFLRAHDLWPEKKYIIDFLEQKGWQKMAQLDPGITIWKHPNPRPFAFFSHPMNQIQKISFQPGSITLGVKVTEDDTLIVQQAFMKGWRMKVDNKNDEQEPALHQGLVQAYTVPKGTSTITLYYWPDALTYGGLLSLLGLSLGMITFILERRK